MLESRHRRSASALEPTRVDLVLGSTQVVPRLARGRIGGSGATTAPSRLERPPAPFLLSEASAPLELEAGRYYVFGRGADCDFVLWDPRVSSRHASLTCTGDTFELADLGSRNGTRVNGIAIRRRMLADGDHVRIGQSELAFILARPPELAERVRRERSRFLAGEPGPRTARAVALAGRLDVMPLKRVLEALAERRATGLVRVELEDAGLGVLILETGSVQAARFGDLTGRQAVSRLTSHARGSFRFEPRTSGVEAAREAGRG